MAPHTDRDGKSKTASAVDAEHYPEQNEVSNEVPKHHSASQEHPVVPDGPGQDEIRSRAYDLWCERGCPHGSSEEDWHRAEEELRSKSGTGRIADQLHELSGSVQR